MARNPKPLRGKEFDAWLIDRQERVNGGEVGWLIVALMRNRRRRGIYYKQYLAYKKLCARWTEKGWRGYNSEGQWLRRRTKRSLRKWRK